MIYTLCLGHNPPYVLRLLVSGAAAELRLKCCVSCGWLGSESDSAATVPATHVSCGRRASDAPNRMQKIPQRRHVQRTGSVPSRYLQRAFAVPPATRPYDGVRVCTSVARRRCVEGTTHVRGTHGHVLPAQSIYNELITGIPKKITFNLKHGENTSINMAWYPRRLGLLRLHLVAEGQRRNNLIMALIIRERQRLQEERRVWHYWVRPWTERRWLFGQYHTLFQELERESHGDCQAYIRMDPNTFAELLLRVALRITKGPMYVIIFFFWVISMISCSNMLTQAAHLHNNSHVNAITWISNFIPHFTEHVITYPCWD